MMKMITLTMNKYARFFCFGLLVLILCSCSDYEKRQFDRSVEVFILGIIQVLNMAVFGSSALTLSIISGSSPKSVFKILGGILSGFFALFTFISYFKITNIGPRHFDVYYLHIISVVMICIAIFFLLKKPTGNNGSKKSISELDEIINDRDEIL